MFHYLIIHFHVFYSKVYCLYILLQLQLYLPNLHLLLIFLLFLDAISIVREGQILIAHTRTEATCDASGAEGVVATPEALTTPRFLTKFINISIIICYVAAFTVCPSTLRRREYNRFSGVEAVLRQ